MDYFFSTRYNHYTCLDLSSIHLENGAGSIRKRATSLTIQLLSLFILNIKRAAETDIVAGSSRWVVITIGSP
jgi:hypothetical protein